VGGSIVRIGLAILALLVGGLGFIGQLVSSLDFKLAQRLGLQERDEATEPIYRRLERNTARWDSLVLWTIPVAAILMLVGHPLWPYAALVGGAVAFDTGGREIAKILGLRAKGVRTGDRCEARIGFGYLALMSLVGLALVVYSFAALV
jgi:hypothetical protein